MLRRHHTAVTLALGFALIAAVLVGVLVQTPEQVISTNSITVAGALGDFQQDTTVCQADERLPASTVALRMSLIAYAGPAVSVTVSHEGRILASGHHNGGWISGSLTLSLKPPVSTPTDAKICLTRNPVALPIILFGNTTPPAFAATVNGTPLPGRMRVEYLAAGRRSWLSLAKHVARRLGLGHSPSGTWIVLPLAALMMISIALGTWLLIREQHE